MKSKIFSNYLKFFVGSDNLHPFSITSNSFKFIKKFFTKPKHFWTFSNQDQVYLLMGHKERGAHRKGGKDGTNSKKLSKKAKKREERRQSRKVSSSTVPPPGEEAVTEEEKRSKTSPDERNEEIIAPIEPPRVYIYIYIYWYIM